MAIVRISRGAATVTAETVEDANARFDAVTTRLFAAENDSVTRVVREYATSVSGVGTPDNILGAYVTAIGGGGGGGSGRRGAAGSVRCGGGGGAVGLLNEYWVPAERWSGTYNVVVGAGGAGGAAVTANDTNGNVGHPGGASSVNTDGVLNLGVSAPGGGTGGSAAAGAGGTVSFAPVTAVGASASDTGGAGGSAGAPPLGPGPGGAGGGITSGDVAGAGGAGAAMFSFGGLPPPGGVVGGAGPSNGSQRGAKFPGSGGGGGAASITGAAQAGGTGAPYGGGGGGGGASLNGNNSGAGGAGGAGFVRITFLCKVAAPIADHVNVWRNGVQFQTQSPGQPWSNHIGHGVDRFEVRAGDQWSVDTGQGRDVERSEFVQVNTTLPYATEIWLSYAFKFIAGRIDTSYCIVGQIHDGGADPGESSAGRSPLWSAEFAVGDGRYKVMSRSDPNAITTTSPSSIVQVERWADTGFVRNRWYRFIWRMIINKTGNGEMQGWRDGVEIYPTTAIPLGYNDVAEPVFKYGIYRAGGSAQTYVAQYTNVEVGTASLAARITSPLAIPAA